MRNFSNSFIVWVFFFFNSKYRRRDEKKKKNKTGKKKVRLGVSKLQIQKEKK